MGKGCLGLQDVPLSVGGGAGEEGDGEKRERKGVVRGDLPGTDPELGWEMSHPLPTDLGTLHYTSLKPAPSPAGDLGQSWLHPA